MMPAFLAAVPAYATLGEVVGVCKEVYGEYLEPAVV
jgi:methylmalonyl-CoA mutase N-terminal domain/subunit